MTTYNNESCIGIRISGMDEVMRGEYVDYKGKMYSVIGVAKDAESGDEVVVYMRTDGQMFVMPIELFKSKVTYNNQEVYRFSYVDHGQIKMQRIKQEKTLPENKKKDLKYLHALFDNEKKDLKRLYSIVDDFLMELKPVQISSDELNRYFETHYVKDLNTLASEFFGHLQNYQFMPNVIGFWKEERKPIFKEILLDYDTHTILDKYDQRSLFEEFCRNFPVKNKDSKQNSWLRYAGGIIDTCVYLNRFKSIEEYNEYCLGFKGSIKLPIEMKNEIRGMGFALACDQLKETGFSDYSKPDVHLRDVLHGCGYCDDDDYSIFECVKRIADENNISPYMVDKKIWLICSGNYYWHNITIPSNKDELIKRIKASFEID